jgi:enediyne biosynthesis protein E4
MTRGGLGRASFVLLVVAAGAVVLHALEAAPPVEPVFREMATECGLVFRHHNGASGRYYMPEIMGAGVALIDYDNDGDLDVYALQGGTLGGSVNDPAAAHGSRLFQNDGPSSDGRVPVRFHDVTARSGLGREGYAMGVAVGDVDGDGWSDMYVTTFGENVLYRNNHDGTFTDITAAAGVDDPRWSTSASFLDYDRDGALDLAVVNYVGFTIAGNKVCTDHLGARDYCPPASYTPTPTRLFRNDGHGRFTDVTETSGVSRAYGAGLGIAAGDFDGDGWLDLYVANDATPNQLWMNRHDGTFVDRALLSGTAFNASGRPEGSMGIAVGDPDNDGDEDIVVTNIVGESQALYVNDGHGVFDDMRTASGLGAATAAMTGFGTSWLDYDHDGQLDLFIANGAVNILEALRGTPVPYRQRNQLFHNTLTGATALRLEEIANERAFTSLPLAVSRGVAVGDIDNDGDQDLVLTSNDGPLRLLINQTNRPVPGIETAPSANHWLEIALAADAGNRFGAGARVGLIRAGQPTLWRRAHTDGSYLSASDGRVHFGLGATSLVGAIVVEWPDGFAERFTAIAADRLMTLRRGAGQPERSR